MKKTRDPKIPLWCIVWGGTVKVLIGKDTKFISKPLGVYKGWITWIEETEDGETVFYTLSYPDLPGDIKISTSSSLFSEGRTKIFGEYIYKTQEEASKAYDKIKSSWSKKISGYLSKNRAISDNYSECILRLEESNIILSELLEE